MKSVQVPVIINNATTGHKLQGSGVDCLFVHSWSYVTNWVYKMLSHVRMCSGLFARQKLSRDLSKYAVPKTLQIMIFQLQTRTSKFWTSHEYSKMFETTETLRISLSLNSKRKRCCSGYSPCGWVDL